MRAVRFHRYGGPEVLDVEDVEPRALQPHDVLVRMRAAGINPGEAKIRSGELRERLPATFPSGQGSDLAGTVVGIGPDVTRWQVGDDVLGWSWERSSQAEYVAVPEDQLVAKPEGLAWEVAGALYVAGCTAHAAVAAVAPRPGETVVVSAASGGVGSIAVQLVRRAGAHVVAVASARHQDWLEAHDATVVPYGEGVAERVRQAAGKAPDAFLDFYGGDYVRLAVDLGVPPDRINTIDYAAAATYGTRSDASAEGTKPEVLAELAGLAATGALEVPISAVHPLAEVRQAFEQLEHGHPLGKIVLLP
ncbi:NADP-dependent oxidoreductase [Streptomyces sp. NBC_00669]|uniref:NADP-dependent oxidoreductase n=1 Tax=Streptomyces sp. NBC_00669 TaxID=2976011 RepID=UPI002E351921|nr:NADP-dependent oxidoreductase [Streptomyces sp. NBC_00669]